MFDSFFSKKPTEARVREGKVSTRARASAERAPVTYDKVLDRTFNWKHPDGRIHATRENGDYHAVTASPYHSEFRSQIEDGVWPVVEALIEKGHLPISSCEGHGGSQLYVTLAFGVEEFARELHDLLTAQRIPGLFVAIREHYFNMRAQSSLGPEAIEFKKSSSIDATLEVQGANALFHRQYDSYVFLEFGLFKNSSAGSDMSLWTFAWRRFQRWLFLNSSRRKLVALIRSEHWPFHAG